MRLEMLRCYGWLWAALLVLLPLESAAIPPHSHTIVNNVPMGLTLSPDRILVKLRRGVAVSRLRQVLASWPGLGAVASLEEIPREGVVLITFASPIRPETRGELYEAPWHGGVRGGVLGAAWPVYLRGQGQPFLVYHRFVVAYRPNIDPARRRALLRAVDGRVVFSFAPGVELVEVGEGGRHDGLGAANLFAQSGLVRWAEADFIRKMVPYWVPNDRELGHQWHLRNTGQRGATPGADVKALSAWDISQGSEDVIIAIIDDGFDLSHEDLQDKLLAGWDFRDNDSDPSGEYSPMSPNWDAHGTSTAGVAAATTNNSKGVAGACPNCSLLPIRLIGSWLTESTEAQALQWAVDRGSAVLSNSWGPAEDGGYYPMPNIVRWAVDYAATEGRNGLGSPVLFAAGNAGYDVSRNGYASYEGVIAVAATTDHDTQASYSNYGDEIDISAPSNGYGWPYDEATTTGIWTTDYSGSKGYNAGSSAYGDTAGHYTNSFGGTSSACPLAAGVAGLIISANPALTGEQVQAILEDTADKIDPAGGDYVNGHSPAYGYGRINALQALLAATGSSSGGIGDPCEVGCTVPYCLTTDSGEYCTDDCLTNQDCPEGFECAPVNGGTQDVCVYEGSTCIPSEEVCDGADNDCDDDVDEGGVCDPGCEGETVEGRCDGETLIFCEGSSVKTLDCAAMNMICTYIDQVDRYDCSAPPQCVPQPEICDDEDNDCDGLIDEDGICCGTLTEAGRCESNVLKRCIEGEVRATDCGALGNICTLSLSGDSYVCADSCNPSAEVCDGLDNDCDGQTDEDNVCSACGAETAVGRCVGGLLVRCDNDRIIQRDCASLGLICGLVETMGIFDCLIPTCGEEVCDGQDNDCDGDIDEGEVCEGCRGETEGGRCEGDRLIRCVDGAVAETDCAAEGLLCGPKGEGSGCVTPCEASDEVCDGLDNDCDGQTDEDGACEGGCGEITEAGLCEGDRLMRCQDDHVVSVDCLELGQECRVQVDVADCRSPCDAIPEVCDGQDNDCDGLTDEDEVCSQGCGDVTARGLCDGDDLLYCAGGNVERVSCAGQGLTCVFNADTAEALCAAAGCDPQEEACDGVDNDCDGLIDEECSQKKMDAEGDCGCQMAGEGGGASGLLGMVLLLGLALRRRKEKRGGRMGGPILLILLATIPVHAQERAFYYHSGQRTSIALTDRVAMEPEGAVTLEDIRQAVAGDPDLGEPQRVEMVRGLAVLPLIDGHSREAVLRRLVESGLARMAWPVYQRGQGHLWLVRDRVVLRPRARVATRDLEALHRSLGARVVKAFPFGPLIVEVRGPLAGDPLAVAVRYQESGLVEWAEPDFMKRLVRRFVPGDTYFDEQWHLHNTGQHGALQGADVKAVAAWDITRGDPSVIIAIIDDGIDPDHEDYGAGKIVDGYDFVDGDGDPSGEASYYDPGWDSHGNSCAGVAAATGDNGIGVSGACPRCSLISVRLIGGYSSDSTEAEAFQFATDHGAWILSNSWGPPDDGGRYPLPSVTRSAIDYARDRGRGGKGSLVFFAAGNGGELISNDGYSSYDRVIAVGASTDHDTWSAYSDYGPELDIMAPSNGYGWPYDEATTPGIFTTDIMGSKGYDNGNYTNSFGGTSSACPLAVGVTGLVLSANPDLTGEEVIDILLSSTDKIGSGYDGSGHSDYYGYGRINAYEAVHAANAQGGSGGAIGAPCDQGCTVPYCITGSQEEYCSDDCIGDIDCPDGFTCEPLEDANGHPVEVCLRGSSSCVPEPEVCDEADNDCDGEVDEGGVCESWCEGETYFGRCEGPNLVYCDEGLGEVHRIDCSSLGVICGLVDQDWGYDCVEAPSCIPSTEVCDGADNDCDGLVDEDGVCLGGCGDVGTEGRCEGSRLLTCSQGTIRETDCGALGMTCGDGGGGVMGCIEGCSPRPEVCDGVDNDCDGPIDEDGVCDQVQPCQDETPGGRCDGLVLVRCVSGMVERIDCSSAGRICRMNDGMAMCLADPCTSQAEVCDGQDNNCNGQIDEGEVCGPPDPCHGETAEGRCEGDLLVGCLAGEVVLINCAMQGLTCRQGEVGANCEAECEGVAGIGQCEGAVLSWCEDDGQARVVRTRDCGQEGLICGLDTAQGRYDCLDQECEPSIEVCDGADNDCDGEVDEEVCQGDGDGGVDQGNGEVVAVGGGCSLTGPDQGTVASLMLLLLGLTALLAGRRG